MQSKLNNSYPPRLYAWLVVLILLLANICSFVDRMILTLLVEPIKADLSLSDTQIGLLHGFAFAAFYALMGLPIGRLADRVHRRNVIVIGITLWSFMTAFCGLARNFLTLFLARMGTGVGEATFNPCAFPLLADYFPKSTRSKAMSLVAIGPYFGGGLSFVLGGLVLGVGDGNGNDIHAVYWRDQAMADDFLYRWRTGHIDRTPGVIGCPGTQAARKDRR